MLSKKRFKTKSRTKSNTRKLSNKKRVKRVSTKQRGGVKRRRTKKSKKKSQKGGSNVVRTQTAQIEENSLETELQKLYPTEFESKKTQLETLKTRIGEEDYLRLLKLLLPKVINLVNKKKR